MLSKRLWLKNRSSTILVELTDFPGIFQSAVKLRQKSSVNKQDHIAKQTWAALSKERKKSLKGRKKFAGILYLLLFVYLFYILTTCRV